jgi:hypothetical protein
MTLGLLAPKAASSIPKSKSWVKTIQSFAAAKSKISESAARFCQEGNPQRAQVHVN